MEFFAYTNGGGWLEYLAIPEDVLPRVMRILEDAGVSIAFPSQTTYLGRDVSPDPEAREAAAAQVRRWIEAGHLPFPDLPEAEAERLRGTVEYPPTPSRPPDDRQESH